MALLATRIHVNLTNPTSSSSIYPSSVQRPPRIQQPKVADLDIGTARRADSILQSPAPFTYFIYFYWILLAPVHMSFLGVRASHCQTEGGDQDYAESYKPQSKVNNGHIVQYPLI